LQRRKVLSLERKSEWVMKYQITDTVDTISPYLKSDIEAVETVQRKYTKKLAGLKKLSYDQMLKILDLPSLELRRLYADLLWCYKIVFGVVDVTRDDFFQLCSTPITRGHMYKLYKPRFTNSKMSNFFACRIINVWNGLPLSTDFSSLNAFKRSIFKTDLSEYLI